MNSLNTCIKYYYTLFGNLSYQLLYCQLLFFLKTSEFIQLLSKANINTSAISIKGLTDQLSE